MTTTLKATSNRARYVMLALCWAANATIGISCTQASTSGSGPIISATGNQRSSTAPTPPAPVRAGDATAFAAGVQNVPYVVTAAELLKGYAAADGDRGTLSVSDIRTDHGAVASLGDGKWVIVPEANYFGTVSLSYNIVDSRGGAITVLQHVDLAALNVGGPPVFPAALIRTPQGVLLAGGVMSSSGDSADCAVARYSPDFIPVMDFGTNGKAIVDFRGAADYCQDAALQADGKILLAGYSYLPNSSHADFALARLNVDGSLNASFGNGGKVFTDFGSYQNIARSVAVQSNGKIVVVGGKGYGLGNTGNYDFALARYNVDGTLDPDFAGGTVTTDFAGNDSACGAAVLADGKILVAGTADAAGKGLFALARYEPNGSLDRTFGNAGRVMTNLSGYSGCGALTVLPDGVAVLAGNSTEYQGQQHSTSLVIARFKADGALDSGFGTGGIARTVFATAFRLGATAVAVANDGGMLVSAEADFYGNWSRGIPIHTDHVLMRYRNDGTLVTEFGDNGVARLPIAGRFFELADGKILLTNGSVMLRINADGTVDRGFVATYDRSGPPVALGASFGGKLPTLASYDGVSLTLTRQASQGLALSFGTRHSSIEDRYSASGTLKPLTPGSELSVDGIVIGTVIANSQGLLSLIFSGAATPELVASTARQIAYHTATSMPLSSVVQIRWVSSAKSGATGLVLPPVTGAATVYVVGAPAAEAEPTVLQFASQAIGERSTPQTVTLTNGGDARLGIANIFASGDFAVSHDCRAWLAPKTSCTLSVTFAPTMAGDRRGTLAIFGDAFDGPAIVTLSGTGAGSTADTGNISMPSNLWMSASTSRTTFGWDPSVGTVGTVDYKIYRDGLLIGSVNKPGFTDGGASTSTHHRYAFVACDTSGKCSAPLVFDTPLWCGVVSCPDSVALSLATGWNLVGNSFGRPLNVVDVFGDATQAMSLWKWIAATGKWAFYTPMLTDGGASIAAARGYDLLTVVDSGEGFWVNARQDFSARLPYAYFVPSASFSDQNSAQNRLSAGWNLISVGDYKTPRDFNAEIGATPSAPNAASASFISLWAWDNASANWYFYSPSLDAADSLATDTSSKRYLNFAEQHKLLGPGIGFWVNKPAQNPAD